LDLRPFGFDDITSSVRLIGGFVAILTRDTGGFGESTTVMADIPDLVHTTVGDNQTSAVIVGTR
jgi:hypothetical protein